MRIRRYILLLAAAAGLAAACQKQEMVMLDVSKAVAPVMHDIDSAGVKNQMIITAANQTSKVTFTWDAADFGAPTQVDYSVEVAVGEGPKQVIVSGITTTDASNTYEAVNQVLFNGLGLKENVLTDVNFYVGATVGSANTVYSAPVSVKAATGILRISSAEVIGILTWAVIPGSISSVLGMVMSTVNLLFPPPLIPVFAILDTIPVNSSPLIASSVTVAV